jgi:hypothetical protein
LVAWLAVILVVLMPVTCRREQLNILAQPSHLQAHRAHPYEPLFDEDVDEPVQSRTRAPKRWAHGSDVCDEANLRDGVGARKRFDDKLRKLQTLSAYIERHNCLQSCPLRIHQLGKRIQHLTTCFPEGDDGVVSKVPPQLEAARPIFVRTLSEVLISFTKVLEAHGLLTAWHAAFNFEPGQTGITCDDNGVVQNVIRDSQAYGPWIIDGVSVGIIDGARIMKVGTMPFSKNILDRAERSEDSYQVTFMFPCKFNPAGLDVAAIIDELDPSRQKPIQNWDTVLLHQLFGRDCVDDSTLLLYIKYSLDPVMSRLALHIVEDVTKVVVGGEVTRGHGRLRLKTSGEPLPDKNSMIFRVTQALAHRAKKSNIKLPHPKYLSDENDPLWIELVYELIWLVTYPLLYTIRVSTAGIRTSIASVHFNVFQVGQASTDSITNVCGADCFNCLPLKCCSYTYDESRHGWPRCNATSLPA